MPSALHWKIFWRRLCQTLWPRAERSDQRCFTVMTPQYSRCGFSQKASQLPITTATNNRPECYNTVSKWTSHLGPASRTAATLWLSWRSDVTVWNPTAVGLTQQHTQPGKYCINDYFKLSYMHYLYYAYLSSGHWAVIDECTSNYTASLSACNF